MDIQVNNNALPFTLERCHTVTLISVGGTAGGHVNLRQTRWARTVQNNTKFLGPMGRFGPDKCEPNTFILAKTK